MASTTTSHLRFTTTPKGKVQESGGFLVQPAQVLDDYTEKVNEVAPIFTILKSQCSTQTEFDIKTASVHSFNFALPHLLKISDTDMVKDKRGQLVELLRTGVSFKNVTNQDIEIHANLPVTKQMSGTTIYTRVSGFRVKVGKKSTLVDDVVLKPNQTGTFKVNLKALSNEYVPLQRKFAERLWLNIIAFCVVVKNTNFETGAAYDPETSIVEARPKAMYTRRKNHPLPVSGILTEQSDKNFEVCTLGGFSDLYEVYPTDATEPAIKPYAGAYPHKPIWAGEGLSECNFVRDQIVEGDQLGMTTIPTGSTHHLAGLTVRKLGGPAKPLNLGSLQGYANRIIVPGLCVNSGDITPAWNGPMAGPITSVWRWDGTKGYWLLFDEQTQQNKGVIHPLDHGTYVSTLDPIIHMTGIYNKEERAAHLKKLIESGGVNQHGLRFGNPDPWGTPIRNSVAVVEVVGKVSGNP